MKRLFAFLLVLAMALTCFSALAEEDDGDSLYKLAREYYDRPERSEAELQRAIALFEMAAELGNEGALFDLAYYYQGERMYAKAVSYYEQLADRNHAIALYNLALIYRSDDLGERDLARAKECFSKSAEAGYAPSAVSLASMYMYGVKAEDGTVLQAPVYPEAVGYFLWAEALGSTDTIVYDNLGYFYCGNKNYVTPDYEKAINYYNKAIELGSGYSLFQVGLMYRDGTYYDVNLVQARDYFNRAVEAGYENAQAYIDLLDANE